MEKQTQDKSMLKSKDISGEELDKGKRADESLNEKEVDVKDTGEKTKHISSGGTLTGTSDKANITTGMNEDKSTINDTSSPSESVSAEKK